jgi:hypothetical protein
MERKAMRRKNILCSGGRSFFAIFIAAISTPAMAAHAQAPSGGVSVAVKMMDAVDSNIDPAGKQYRATVAKAVDAGNGVMIPQGAIAAVTLASNGSARTARLASLTINGQVVTVTTGSGSVIAEQSAAGRAASAMSSLGGALGHHVNAPAGISAVATGQRIVLPPGTTLNFVLSQPLASSPATPAAGASLAGHPATASAAPASAPSSGPAGAAAPGQHWWMCRYSDLKDPSKPALGSFMYYALIPTSGDASKMNGHFNGYVQQNYKVTNSESTGSGFCRRFSDDAATRANSMDMMLKQWASSHFEAVNVKWTDTPAENAAVDAKLAAGKPAPSAALESGAGSKECAYHATCTPPPAAPKPPGR